MPKPMSKTRIDRLGDRLRAGYPTEADLRMLDEYRRSFADAYEYVMRTLREQGLDPTGRSAKSTSSIVAKLLRESIRLTQIQDIAGCRVIVGGIMEQDRVASLLSAAFPGASVIDRRETPSHGYRAVHIVPFVSGRAVEIQVRTALQHQWAEVSEKFSDVIDPALKYGGGPDEWRALLTQGSKFVASWEVSERLGARALAAYAEVEKGVADLTANRVPIPQTMKLGAEDLRREIRDTNLRGEHFRQAIADALADIIAILGTRTRQ